MLKVECSKYPIEKCQHCEDKNWKLCEYCQHNMYQNVSNLDTVLQDNFKKVDA